MNLDLKNKNAIVSGSTQGIGEAAAIELAKLGANITLIARNESKLLNVLNELDKSQGQVHSFICIVNIFVFQAVLGKQKEDFKTICTLYMSFLY